MPIHDPVSLNIVVDYLGRIVLAFIGLLLIMLKVLGRKDKAVAAKAILTESPVSHAELLQCQLTVNKTIDDNFKALRRELMREIGLLHKKVNRLS